MNRNHKKLVECLLEHKESWMTADSLAALLGVSKRSIKTYIAQLKQENPAIVTSSRQGYRIQAAAGQRFLADQAAFCPQTPPQRVRPQRRCVPPAPPTLSPGSRLPRPPGAHRWRQLLRQWHPRPSAPPALAGCR